MIVCNVVALIRKKNKTKAAGLPDEKNRDAKAARDRPCEKQLENCHLYVQEFFWILAEIADHQAHIAC